MFCAVALRSIGEPGRARINDTQINALRMSGGNRNATILQKTVENRVDGANCWRLKLVFRG
jgi:hypothetical protein